MVRLLLIAENMTRRLALAGLTALLLLTFTPAPLRSQSLDSQSTEALAATLRMLTDPVARGRVIAGDPSAAEVDRQVQGMAGTPALAQEVYGIAAEVFADLVRNTDGDPRRMSEALDQAKSDPAGFAAMLRPETLERLRALATKISDAPR
jgi:hypothetical protein